jgi:NitT/TauT family transport system permease protein
LRCKGGRNVRAGRQLTASRRQSTYRSLYDLAFGGIYDEAYSRTLHVHLLAPLSRVYGGFAIAASLAVPLGLLIGRISIVRRLLDPLCRFCAQSP